MSFKRTVQFDVFQRATALKNGADWMHRCFFLFPSQAMGRVAYNVLARTFLGTKSSKGNIHVKVHLTISWQQQVH